MLSFVNTVVYLQYFFHHRASEDPEKFNLFAHRVTAMSKENLKNTAGRNSAGRIPGNHYSQSDILKLSADRSERNIVEDMKPRFEGPDDTHLDVMLKDPDSQDKKA